VLKGSEQVGPHHRSASRVAPGRRHGDGRHSRRLGHLGSITGLRSSLGQGPPLDPGRRFWQFVVQGARVGLAPQRSRTELVLYALESPFTPRWQSHRSPSPGANVVEKVVDDLVDDPGHGSPMDARTVGTVGSVLGSLPGSGSQLKLDGTRWGSVRSGTSSSASASMACRS
jgi:hypothetical protein